MARFKKPDRAIPDIPVQTMADISFLLIIFFMVTTTFVVYRGFHVNLPFAKMIDPLHGRRNIATLWIGPNGDMVLDEHTVNRDTLAGVVNKKLTDNPRIIVQVKADKRTTYNHIATAVEELKKAHALRVSFIAQKE